MSPPPNLDTLLDPQYLHLRLYRVWVLDHGRQFVQHVSAPLPSWWADATTPDYRLVLAASQEDAAAGRFVA